MTLGHCRIDPRRFLGLLALFAFGRVATAAPQDATPTPEAIQGAFPAEKNYSPYAGRSFPTRVWFGDTHLHTAASMDAGAFGCRLGIEAAYRFARGEEITTSTGQRAKLGRPLDYLVVTDHSDNMGFFPKLFAGDPELLQDPTGRRWYDMIKSGEGGKAAIEIVDSFSKGTFPKALYFAPGTPNYRSAWEETIRMAEKFNEPGRFTAFIGYEWTSLAPPGNNLHRNVIFRDGGDKAIQIEPFTCYSPKGSIVPEDLWKTLQAYEEKTGGRVLAIPHNGNLSNGMMFPFDLNPASGKPLTKDYVESRARWEPLYEVVQTKGDGESHPFLSPNDELATFERWDVGNLNLSEAKKPEMLAHEYARSALQLGMQLELKLGTNPYKFGMVGATDSHTSLATVEEDNFFGKVVTQEPGPKRATETFIKQGDLKIMDWQTCAAGLGGVWATDNTREALWDAMKRKETYATTGTRLIVRFFGGFDFTKTDANTRNPAMVGYSKGVPMGGDLHAAPAGKAPTFLVAALKDPYGGNLDRVQIVKCWLDAKGERNEKVYDVAWGGDRKPGTDGKLPPVGNTVDVTTATWTNTIGAPELINVWKDPEFDPKSRALYYVRVIEIPTPRWTCYDAVRFGLKLPPEIPLTITERAYTSPIWYSPAP